MALTSITLPLPSALHESRDEHDSQAEERVVLTQAMEPAVESMRMTIPSSLDTSKPYLPADQFLTAWICTG
jgi:hypothetical protein